MKVELLTGRIGQTNFKSNSTRKNSCPNGTCAGLNTEITFKGSTGGDSVSFKAGLAKAIVSKTGVEETFAKAVERAAGSNVQALKNQISLLVQAGKPITKNHIKAIEEGKEAIAPQLKKSLGARFDNIIESLTAAAV